MKESGVTNRLAETARTSMTDIVTILLGLCVGIYKCSKFLTRFYKDLFLGALSFAIQAGGVLVAKIINLFLKEDNKINPFMEQPVSAIPASARVRMKV